MKNIFNILSFQKNNKFKLTLNLFIFLTYLFVINLPIKKALSENNKLLNLEYLEQKKSFDYILGPGDVLSINLSNTLPFSLEGFVIDPSGTIKLPKINSVYVKGLTLKELEVLLKKRYVEILNNPNIELYLIKKRPVKVYITGEVESPGLYTLIHSENEINNEIQNQGNTESYNEPNTESNNQDIFFRSSSNSSPPTLYDLIQKAGGVTLKSDLQNIEVIRINSISNGGGKIKAIINLQDLLEFGEFSNNIGLFDGDYIKIKTTNKDNLNLIGKAIKSNLNPKYIEVYVTGRVDIPGIKTVSKRSTLNEAILISGGKKFFAGKLNFVRINNDGSYEKRKINYRKSAPKGSYNNPYLRNGDFIIVGRGKIATFNEIISEITSPFVGIYSTLELYDKLVD